MNKWLIAAGLCASALTTYSQILAHPCEPQEPMPVTVNWKYQGVYALKTIPKGGMVDRDNVEGRAVNKGTDESVLAGNIKSQATASQRVAKREIKPGELLMFSDFGEQPYAFGRPCPEEEVH